MPLQRARSRVSYHLVPFQTVCGIGTPVTCCLSSPGVPYWYKRSKKQWPSKVEEKKLEGLLINRVSLTHPNTLVGAAETHTTLLKLWYLSIASCSMYHKNKRTTINTTSRTVGAFDQESSCNMGIRILLDFSGRLGLFLFTWSIIEYYSLFYHSGGMVPLLWCNRGADSRIARPDFSNATTGGRWAVCTIPCLWSDCDLHEAWVTSVRLPLKVSETTNLYDNM